MIRVSVAMFVIMITLCGLYNIKSAQGASEYGLAVSGLRCDQEERPGKDKTTAVTVPGDYLQATLAALEDFKKKIKREEQGRNDPLSLFLSDFKNYDIYVTQKDRKGNYRISFGTKVYRGQYLKGGGAEYVVDGQTYKIVKKEYFM